LEAGGMEMSIFDYEGVHNTDKFTLGYVNEIYNDLFVPIADSVSNVLEIGIQYGPSIKLWRDFFPNAQIYGADIEKLVDFSNEERIITYYGNAYTKTFVNSLEDGKFDIVIDDGPHTYESMVFFLQNYLSKVKPGGYLVVEDIVDCNWTPKLLEIIDSELTTNIIVYEMKGKQTTPELLSRWSNGLDVIVIQRK
jgi:SAM-dependent methyltransferase